MNDIEIDFEELIETLFNNHPKEPNSFNIDFDCGDTFRLFQDLLTIFNNGCKILFGDKDGKVNLEDLSADDFNYLNEYFLSFGFNIYYTIYDKYDVSLYKTYVCGYMDTYLKLFDKIKMKDLIRYKDVETNKLEDYRFQLRVKNKIYIIGFESKL